MWPFYYNWTTFSHQMKIKKMAEKTFFSLPELALAGVKLNIHKEEQQVKTGELGTLFLLI